MNVATYARNMALRLEPSLATLRQPFAKVDEQLIGALDTEYRSLDETLDAARATGVVGGFVDALESARNSLRLAERKVQRVAHPHSALNHDAAGIAAIRSDAREHLRSSVQQLLDVSKRQDAIDAPLPGVAPPPPLSYAGELAGIAERSRAREAALLAGYAAADQGLGSVGGAWADEIASFAPTGGGGQGSWLQTGRVFGEGSVFGGGGLFDAAASKFRGWSR